MPVVEGDRGVRGLRFAIVVSRFNDSITERLLTEAVRTLRQAGVEEPAIHVARVPGAFEIPLVAQQFAASGSVHAVICLGAVIRGETPHFEYISREASRGVGQVALQTKIPVIFGVLTTDTVEQAVERAGPSFNRGGEAARAAIEMATLLRQLGTTR